MWTKITLNVAAAFLTCLAEHAAMEHSAAAALSGSAIAGALTCTGLALINLFQQPPANPPAR